MEKIDIHLEKFLMPNDDYLSGRPEGNTARRNLKLDKYDNEEVKINTVISDKIIGINVSFFLGLYSISINRLGSKEKFLEKFSFEICSSNKDRKEIILGDINYGIKEALDESDFDDLFD